MERPLGLIMIWKDEPLQIMNTGLFGYYQNGVDYLTTYAQAKGWKLVPSSLETSITYKAGEYRIELGLVQAQGIDLSQETYLFQETTDASQDQETAKS
jgi:hypothetical protein